MAATIIWGVFLGASLEHPPQTLQGLPQGL